MDLRVPKVLIACPTSDRHEQIIDEWIEHLNSLNYPNFDLMLVDTSLKSNKYYKKLKTKKLEFIALEINDLVHKFKRKIIVKRHEWNPDKKHPIQMLADAREEIRHYFLEHKEYSYLFSLDDDIFIPKNGIQRLISHKKDAVGFYVHVFPKGWHKPCILKSGGIILGKGLDYYSFKEIDAYKQFIRKFKQNKLTSEEKGLIPHIIQDIHKPGLFKAYGVGLGCLMLNRKILTEIPFRTHPTFINGEDLWFFAEANEKHFEFWCDPIRCRHENTEWYTIIKETPKEMNFLLAHGPTNAKKAVILRRKHTKIK